MYCVEVPVTDFLKNLLFRNIINLAVWRSGLALLAKKIKNLPTLNLVLGVLYHLPQAYSSHNINPSLKSFLSFLDWVDIMKCFLPSSEPVSPFIAGPVHSKMEHF